MKVGLGLPISEPAALLEWARGADAGPFSTLGLLDRLVYDNPEPLVALAVLAGATSRIRLQTEVLLAPLREPALLAKQCATLDRMSGGRFTLGVGLGARRDDYEAAGADVHRRGARLEEMMEVMRRIWSGEPYGEGIGPIGPEPARRGGPEVLFGAFSPVGIRRAARLGDGFLCAAHLADAEDLFRATETEWQAQGRTGRPRLVAQFNAALGPDHLIKEARDRLYDYYGGPHYMNLPAGFADGAVASMLTTSDQIRDTATRMADIGADEVMFYCWNSDVGQVDRFAGALSGT
ncbi:Flavin-dependent oxidoreductase, luciferase family (includes alkanesulfonate monooxygenase SsuD and methylene tetrahydromethanopterin reductase) [Streptosporangium subroseum]|uniref:Flavin-dependent oxidoreductase, luciferase family (Includes alkanesulfonate monooxygenase SsuD and methylene tetrahydromethanopterin reductase) n=1 Tax=Streptosporangium subroseum TaxID=106412 RepID=A0A239I229_9ACTN|nr:LLM class flavin-dependent oxidoreductase [Streptosporangium subroseum]SNS87655.1 Flavin-dependent oxidoreductase, luciferase family (includes alkanesulfonate monooxygenase SsuD and methylene tetrahydromethanopterin reductase) [Streptosporangium subroseum]